MIVILNYGMGNLGSILNMLKKAGGDAVISADAIVIDKADKLILPGVGAFDKAMSNLKELGFIEVLNQKVQKEKTPVLGICLGMQLLSKSSEEGILPGLGWLDAKVKKFAFPSSMPLKIPHMGWNIVSENKKNPLFENMPKNEMRFYFVHSYYFDAENPKDIIGQTNYGFPFPSAVNQENIFGVQFHPEKSHQFGMQLLKNFIAL
mgnify:CR=1 FL=1